MTKVELLFSMTDGTNNKKLVTDTNGPVIARQYIRKR